jgi:hypothetical protein
MRQTKQLYELTNNFVSNEVPTSYLTNLATNFANRTPRFNSTGTIKPVIGHSIEPDPLCSHPVNLFV